MPNDVPLGKFNNGDALGMLQRAVGLGQAGMFMRREVNLGFVTSDDSLGTVTEARQKHQHLLRGGILGLIQNDERAIQGAAAHIGQRGDFNGAALRVLLELFHGQHVMQGIMQRPEVGRDFFVQVAGQKAERLARFHRRTRENDARN